MFAMVSSWASGPMFRGLICNPPNVIFNVFLPSSMSQMAVGGCLWGVGDDIHISFLDSVSEGSI